MEFEIRIDRPVLLLLLVGGFLGVMLTVLSPAGTQAAVGGDDTSPIETIVQTQADIRELREEQSVLTKREAILREQLQALYEERELYGNDPVIAVDISIATQRLTRLLQDQRSAEGELLSSLRQQWEAEGYARIASKKDGVAPSVLQWPVEARLGISAYFQDKGYRTRFGMDHNAIDIPVAQGTTIRAPADGVVATVSDKGLGFSSLVIDHGGGMATLYGHVSSFLVTEGQAVRAGDSVALSGGRPGTAGAGMFTTGPHLHFEVHLKGSPVNPLEYLPR